jgi:hypothetical protein
MGLSRQIDCPIYIESWVRDADGRRGDGDAEKAMRMKGEKRVGHDVSRTRDFIMTEEVATVMRGPPVSIHLLKL